MFDTVEDAKFSAVDLKKGTLQNWSYTTKDFWRLFPVILQNFSRNQSLIFTKFDKLFLQHFRSRRTFAFFFDSAFSRFCGEKQWKRNSFCRIFFHAFDFFMFLSFFCQKRDKTMGKKLGFCQEK